MATVQEYFTYSLLWSRLMPINRYNDCRIKLDNWHLTIPDSLSFIHSYKEIFVDKIYAFKWENKSPNILDLGSNIGLSILFFKSLYPDANITGFEADPKIFKYLEKNINDNSVSQVKLVNKAIWYENTYLNFVSEGADAGKVSHEKGNSKVEATDILEVLNSQKFDFLKMDIEGAEEFVIPRCRGFLNDLKFIFIEYHSKLGQEQCLDKILLILKEAGFRIHIRNVNDTNLSPFIGIKLQSEFDLQLNIFGWK
ncbi:MAG: FkbM family methyltransferase [Microcystis aeruginosa K13-06]|jgi:FkbM family methyltransferase|nr:FkbM family methyltransferase [Microcystis aeruginosa]NCR78133.1 FkbM family methyltransferase [Microcystis aeruginosa K13-06]